MRGTERRADAFPAMTPPHLLPQSISERKRQGGKKPRGEPHVRLYIWMMKTAAWRSLSTQARAVFVEIAARYNGSNNGKIWLSVRDAANGCRISKDTATRAFCELEDKGFIVRKSQGAFSLKKRHATEWLLTEHRDDVDNAMPTKAFMAWRKNQNAVPNE